MLRKGPEAADKLTIQVACSGGVRPRVQRLACEEAPIVAEHLLPRPTLVEKVEPATAARHTPHAATSGTPGSTAPRAKACTDQRVGVAARSHGRGGGP